MATARFTGYLRTMHLRSIRQLACLGVVTILAWNASATYVAAEEPSSIVVTTKARTKGRINQHYRASEHWRPLRHVLRFNHVDRLRPGVDLKLPTVKEMLRTFGLPAALQNVTEHFIDSWQELRSTEYTVAKCQKAMTSAQDTLSAYKSFESEAPVTWILKSLDDALHEWECPPPLTLETGDGKFLGRMENRLDRAVMSILAWTAELRDERAVRED